MVTKRSKKYFRVGYIQKEDCTNRYVRKNKSPHIDFHCHESRLFISQAYSCLGASPDGAISCNFCGEGILEKLISEM